MNMKIIEMDISEVIPYANNPRDNSKAIDAVAASIKEFGFKVPVVIDKNNILITGHTRLEAAKKLGITKIPAIRASDLTDAQVKAFRLADNKVAEIATWDDQALAAELRALDDLNFDMSDFGFSEDDLGDNTDDIAEPEVPENPDPIAQPGDLFQLGDHRLLCGDSTNPEDIARLTGGQEMGLLLTDPPYNVAYEGKTAAAMTIENDSMSSEEYIDFLTRALRASSGAIKKGGGFYIFYPNSFTYEVTTALHAVRELQIKQVLIWIKNSIVLGRQDYQWQHEPCLYGWKAGGPHYFCDSRCESTVIDDCPDIGNRPDIGKMSKADLQSLCRELLNRTPCPTSLLREDKPARSDIHPTMKPVKLFARLMANSTRKGEAVLDIFGGSGTTIIAAEQLGRRAYAMELSPRYCDAIISRWEAMTGKKAVKL